MSDDWKVGDLAVCVDDGILPLGGTLSDANGLLRAGRAYRVTEVHSYRGPHTAFEGVTCLMLAEIVGRFNGFYADRFRKIRPDEHEACEEEFVTLLKRKRVAA